MPAQLTRRSFLGGAASGVLALTLSQLGLGESAGRALGGALSAGDAAAAALPGYRGWEDVYRQKWSWDKVVRGAHHVINGASACPFNLFVKDGIVLREEQ